MLTVPYGCYWATYGTGERHKNLRDDGVTITTLHDRLEGGQIAIYFAAVL
ncbi:hypothetical protein ACFSUK_20515 [Sphingobium scionense]